jgi:hypothetical protein
MQNNCIYESAGKRLSNTVEYNQQTGTLNRQTALLYDHKFAKKLMFIARGNKQIPP